MATIDFTSGYRDATKGATLKALQKRRDDQAAATALAMKPREIGSMWQGAAQIGDVISGSIREGRLANQEAAGRTRFAELLAGGLAPDEIGEAMGLDPETAMKYQERTWASEDTEKKHRWDVDAAAQRVRDERATQEAGFTHSDTQQKAGFTHADTAQEDAQKHAFELKKAEGQAEVDEIGKKVEARKAAAAKIGLVEGTPEYEKYVATETMPSSPNLGGPAGLKAINEMGSQVGQYDSALNSFNRALELVDKIPTELLGSAQLDAAKLAADWGPYALDKAVEMVHSIPGYEKVTTDQVNDLLEYDRLVGLNAMTTMSTTLKGQSTDREMAAFLQRLANPNMRPDERKRTIQNFMAAIQSDRDNVAISMKEFGREPDPYAWKSSEQPADPTAPAPAATTAPAPAAATTTPAPTTPATPAPDHSAVPDDELDAIIRRGPQAR